MNPIDINKFVRWSIPGWVAILSVFLFIGVDILSTPGGGQLSVGEISRYLKTLGLDDVNVSTFLVALAGFPLGFLIYQFYFFVRWNSPFSENGLFPPLIMGRQVDLERIIRDVPPEQLVLHYSSWRDNWIKNNAFKNDHGFKGQYIESLITEIIQKIDTKYMGSRLYDRYRYLVEMTHTLGAALGGIYIGFAGYLLIKVRVGNLPITTYLVSLACLLVVLLFLLEYETPAHRKKQEQVTPPEIEEGKGESKTTDHTSKNKIHISHPTILFLVFMGFVIFLASPSLISNNLPMLNQDYLSKSLLIILIIVGLYKWSATKEEKWLVGLILIIEIIIGIAFRIHRDVFVGLDWPYLNSLFIFLVVNTVLLKNRQNSNDDSIALQNYSLKRFLNDENCCLDLVFPTKARAKEDNKPLTHPTWEKE